MILKKEISIALIALDGVLVIDTYDRATKSAKQDQTECMCRLISVYIL